VLGWVPADWQLQKVRAFEHFRPECTNFALSLPPKLKPLNYKMAVGKLLKIVLVKFFTKSGTPWLALISRF
jgi:hypothetical protein